MLVGQVERSKKDPSLYNITQKGILYRNQFRSFVSMMEDDLNKISHEENKGNQLIASLKLRSF
jgi:hypothetical protein